MQIHLPAIAALEGVGDVSRKWQSATPAKRWGDGMDFIAAVVTGISLPVRGPLLGAELADIRINETQGGVGPGEQFH